MDQNKLTPRRNRAQARVEAKQTDSLPLWPVAVLTIGVVLLALI
ncbi:hypothetical protein ACS3SW_17370 [Roseobacteraceae bacterium S113]